MTDISVSERVEAALRANKALKHLEDHPDTTRGQLGAARDHLNIVTNLKDQWAVDDSVYALECIVLNVYGGIPEGDR